MYCTSIISFRYTANNVAKAELIAALSAYGGTYCFSERDDVRIDVPDLGRGVRVGMVYCEQPSCFVFVQVFTRDNESKVYRWSDISAEALCYLTNKIPAIEGGIMSVKGVLPAGDAGVDPELPFLIGQSVQTAFHEAEVPLKAQWRMIEPLARLVTSRAKSRTGTNSFDVRSYFDGYSQEEMKKEMDSWKETILCDYFHGPLLGLALEKYRYADHCFQSKVFSVFGHVVSHGVKTLSPLNDMFGHSVLKHLHTLEEDGFIHLNDDGRVEVSYTNLRGYFN